MTVAADLVAALDPVGVPIRGPGSTVGTFPCVAVRPADDRLEASSRYLVRGFVVTAMVARTGAVAQLADLETLATTVLETLLDAGYRIGNPHRYVAGESDGANYFGREYPVDVDGEVFC